MAMIEKHAIKLDWQDVCAMVAVEIKSIISVEAICKAIPAEGEYWDISFEDYRLPLSKLCLLLQSVSASLEDWEDALPDEGGATVISLGMAFGEATCATFEAHMGALLDSGRQFMAGRNIKTWR